MTPSIGQERVAIDKLIHRIGLSGTFCGCLSSGNFGSRDGRETTLFACAFNGIGRPARKSHTANRVCLLGGSRVTLEPVELEGRLDRHGGNRCWTRQDVHSRGKSSREIREHIHKSSELFELRSTCN